MEPEMERFKEDIDAWVKVIRRQFSEFSHVSAERDDCLLYNIFDLQDQIEELKQEVNALKLIQIINLKEQEAQRVRR